MKKSLKAALLVALYFAAPQESKADIPPDSMVRGILKHEIMLFADGQVLLKEEKIGKFLSASDTLSQLQESWQRDFNLSPTKELEENLSGLMEVDILFLRDWTYHLVVIVHLKHRALPNLITRYEAVMAIWSHEIRRLARRAGTAESMRSFGIASISWQKGEAPVRALGFFKSVGPDTASNYCSFRMPFLLAWDKNRCWFQSGLLRRSWVGFPGWPVYVGLMTGVRATTAKANSASFSAGSAKIYSGLFASLEILGRKNWHSGYLTLSIAGTQSDWRALHPDIWIGVGKKFW